MFSIDTLSEKMSNNSIPSFVNLSVKLIYRILDCLDPFDLLISVRNVCTHLDRITDTYHPYQVNVTIIREEDSFDLLVNEPHRMLISF